jgi:flagellar biosynthesis protein FlhF
MKLKTFQGRSMADALEQVKRQFGRDAVILNTRTFTRGGFLGLGGKPFVEITAAKDRSDLPGAVRRGTVQTRLKAGDRADGAVAPLSPGSSPVANTAASDSVLTEVGALKSLVSELLRETRRTNVAKVPGALYDTYRALVENAVAEELATELVESLRGRLNDEQMHDAKAVHAHLAKALEAMLPTAGPIRIASRGEPYIVALIGPTGVGKTTTIAKLAANFCLRDRKKVGLITIDTYRIAAVEQLKTYAQIIDVPLEVAMSPDQLKEAVVRMADRDVILIDTAGRSQRDAMKIQELRGFFGAVKPHETHLVLSSACSEMVLTETIDRFRDVGVDRVIFTKLDEALGFGVILTCLQKVDARLSYVTTGQDVPSDIEVGEGSALAELILRLRAVEPR